MGVSDERSGLAEPQFVPELSVDGSGSRAHARTTPLALTILQIDRGGELLRQQGESPMERFLEQLARSLQPIVRQNDVAVKYTSWSLAFILPDTTLAGRAEPCRRNCARAASGFVRRGIRRDHA